MVGGCDLGEVTSLSGSKYSPSSFIWTAEILPKKLFKIFITSLYVGIIQLFHSYMYRGLILRLHSYQGLILRLHSYQGLILRLHSYQGLILRLHSYQGLILRLHSYQGLILRLHSYQGLILRLHSYQGLILRLQQGYLLGGSRMTDTSETVVVCMPSGGMPYP